jgi:hypothetical protein
LTCDFWAEIAKKNKSENKGSKISYFAFGLCSGPSMMLRGERLGLRLGFYGTAEDGAEKVNFGPERFLGD